MKKWKVTDYGKGLKSHLEINRNKIMLKYIFLKTMQPIKRARLVTGKPVLATKGSKCAAYIGAEN